MLPKLTWPQRQTSMQEDIDKHSLGAQLLFFSEKGHLALVDFFPDRTCYISPVSPGVSCASHVSQHYCGLAAWTTSMTITPNSRTPFAANWVFQNWLGKSQNCPLVPQVFFWDKYGCPCPKRCSQRSQIGDAEEHNGCFEGHWHIAWKWLQSDGERCSTVSGDS